MLVRQTKQFVVVTERLMGCDMCFIVFSGRLKLNYQWTGVKHNKGENMKRRNNTGQDISTTYYTVYMQFIVNNDLHVGTWELFSTTEE